MQEQGGTSGLVLLQNSSPHPMLGNIQKPRSQGPFLLGPLGAVTVIRTFPRFVHPHSQNPSDMGIRFSYCLGDLGQSQGQGYRGCPYHQGFGNGGAQNAGMLTSLSQRHKDRVEEYPGSQVGTSKTVVDFRIHSVDSGLQVNQGTYHLHGKSGNSEWHCSNGSRHSVCGASENMRCPADLSIHCSGSFSHHVKFYSFFFLFLHTISSRLVCVNGKHPDPGLGISCQWNLHSGFHSSGEFHIPKPRIPIPQAKKVAECGIRNTYNTWGET